jgi:NADH-quinone oxidoreductase subunit A
LSFIFFEKKKIKNIKKKSIYEWGFESFVSCLVIFNIKNIIIGLLFIIFDLEILFILPWLISSSFLSYIGFFTIYIVLLFFIFGFVYEYLIGAIN